MKKNPDEYWMQLALAEAAKGKGLTSPNPMVGAVLVKNDRLLAKGNHRRAGLPHAEIEAMARASDLRDATLYVTLEPCCHSGKRTPPCTDHIIGSGIRRVVVGTLDPNPQVSGRGLKILQKSGIQTALGALQEECTELNRYYNHWIRKKTPYVILKSALSLDGRVALKNGRSKWITGQAARARVHELRSEVDAVLVGIGTVLADDPQLNARIPTAQRQPARIILDPHFKISKRARLFRTKPRAPIYVFVSRHSFQPAKAKKLEQAGAGIVVFPTGPRGNFDLKKILQQLGRWGLVSLLVEGGPSVWTGFFKNNLFDEWWLFLAPKLLGSDARPFLGPLGLKKIAEKSSISLIHLERLQDDVLLRFART